MTVLYRWTGHDVTDVGVQEFASVVTKVLEGPLAVLVEVYEARPKHHFGTGGREGILKESAPAYPKGSTGVALAQEFADQCEGAVWERGAVTALMFSSRFEVDDGAPKAKIRVTISAAPAATIGELILRSWPDPPHATLAFSL